MSDNDKLKEQIAQNAAAKQQRAFQLAFGITPHLPDLKLDFIAVLTNYKKALASEPKPLLPEKVQEWMTRGIVGDPSIAELAAERDEVRLRGRTIEQLKTQLLQAQAAMKEINDWVLWIKEPLLRDEDKRAAKVAAIIDDVTKGFSLLHAHDQEVCKPLVEALELARQWLPNSRCPTLQEEKAYEIIDAALSKFKESNAATVEGKNT